MNKILSLCCLAVVMLVSPLIAQVTFNLSPSPGSITLNVATGVSCATTLSLTNNAADTTAFSLLTIPPTLLANQISYYPFNGNHNDLITNTNGVITGTNFTADRHANPLHALHFDGNDHYSAREHGLDSTFTVSFWAKPTVPQSMSGAGYYGFAIYANYLLAPEWAPTGPSAGLGISLGTNGIMVAEHANSYMPVLISYSADLSGWNFYTVTFNNRIPKLYINGALASSGLMSQRTATFLSSEFGNYVYGSYTGDFDDLSIYNGVLTPEQIQEAYAYTENSRYLMSPVAGTIEPAANLDVNVNLIDTTLSPGLYNDIITLVQASETPAFMQIPVSLNVFQLAPLAPSTITITQEPDWDILLQWSEVTEDNAGQPFTPALYKIYAGNTLSPMINYSLIGTSTTTQFTHPFDPANPLGNIVFYYVTAE